MSLVEDVVFQILLRCPVRSLLRFRCVCKDWCSMINTPLFKDTYLALRRAAAMDVDNDDQVVGLKSTLVSDISMDLSDLDLSAGNILAARLFAISMTGWYDDYHSLAISAWTPSCNEFEISGNHPFMMSFVNHVNGVVCICGICWDDITLVNPGLRETRKLPLPNILDLDLDFGRFKIHPQGKFGFGYDDSDNEYKVVLILMAFEGNDIFRYIGLVYHLSTNSWKILGDISAFVSLPGMYSIKPESTFSHGSIHWCIQLKIDDPDDGYYYYQYRILAYNLSNESFREIHLPHGWRHHEDGKFPVLLTIDKSYIALVNCPCNHDGSSDVQELEVWVMKESGDSVSWTKRYSISSLPRFISPLSFWKNDKLLLLIDSKLVCYDLNKGQPDEPAHGYPPICVPGIQRLRFVTGYESFVSVKQV